MKIKMTAIIEVDEKSKDAKNMQVASKEKLVEYYQMALGIWLNEDHFNIKSEILETNAEEHNPEAELEVYNKICILAAYLQTEERNIDHQYDDYFEDSEGDQYLVSKTRLNKKSDKQGDFYINKIEEGEEE